MLYPLFEELGFTEKEVTVYTTLLSLGPAKVAEISGKSNLNRTTLYDILESLTKKGLVSKFKKRKTHYFQALDPRQLLTYIDDETNEVVKIAEKRKARIEHLLPELISLQHNTTTQPKIRFFQGERGLRAAYKVTLTAKGPMLAYSNIESMTHLLPNFMPEYWKERARKKLLAKAIFADNSGSRKRAELNQQELRITKFLPQGLMFTPEVKIFDNKTLITSWEEQMAVLIESKEYADLQKIIFNLLWGYLK
jgi:sugar-specific transcriptional regulator TrmB